MAEQKRLEEQAQRLAQAAQSKSSDIRMLIISFVLLVPFFNQLNPIRIRWKY